jgi:hypothetical protein
MGNICVIYLDDPNKLLQYLTQPSSMGVGSATKI